MKKLLKITNGDHVESHKFIYKTIDYNSQLNLQCGGVADIGTSSHLKRIFMTPETTSLFKSGIKVLIYFCLFGLIAFAILHSI
jgi:hypothetical protein